MTALLTLERGRLSDTFSPRRLLPRAPAESQIEPARAASGCRSRDLLRGLLIESANDAAATLAEGIGGLSARSCAR